jgi:hypothetical protein
MYVRSQPAPSGAPSSYRLQWCDSHDYMGCTLSALAADGTKKRLNPMARNSGGTTLIFIASGVFEWRFPDQLQLFLSLVDFVKTNCVVTGNLPGTLSGLNHKWKTERDSAGLKLRRRAEEIHTLRGRDSPRAHVRSAPDNIQREWFRLYQLLDASLLQYGCVCTSK